MSTFYDDYISIFKDTPSYEEDRNDEENGVYWTGTWNYEQLWLEDHFALPIYKISRLLDRITGLQVTSPDLNGRESEIPLSFDLASKLEEASDFLMVNL